ncbi:MULTISPECIES: hypothetical protein [unclassified Streptomyces]|uniref:hypothetical protein n=1 Tax=unclassified Streptomyces TaxID=2593676 RepID=UPI00225181D1|nr:MULTISPECIES: hypothetical protein [unclassified Streptomyces]MCX4880673.1 hypothetical protein [Streptomyces sp. NBC_00847]MCX5420664.1 hypothetical protein [Streptomyces sp. NBC_00078]
MRSPDLPHLTAGADRDHHQASAQRVDVPGRFPTTVTGGWVVFAVWAGVAAVLAVVVVDRRDV